MSGRSVAAMLLAWAIPGAGHLFLGRRARGVAFFSIVAVLFLVGLSVDGSLYTLARSGGSGLRVLAACASLGSGFFYIVANALGPHGNVASSTFEYGTTFTLTAGLMNLLLVLDCYDIANERKS